MARGLTREAAAKKLGTSSTALSAVINGKRALSRGLEAMIILTFGVNKDWLSNGVGEMFSEGIDLSLKIPFFDLEKFECGNAAGFAGALVKSKADCYITLPGVVDVRDMFAVRAHGISMINRKVPSRSIGENTIVVFKRVEEPMELHWGETYALATNEGYIIKKVAKSESEGMISCISYNVEDGYEPFDVPAESIYDLAEVVAVINMQ